MVKNCRKKFWWEKVFTLSVFQKKFELSVFHDFSTFLPKIQLFLQKKKSRVFVGNRQTIFFKNEKLKPRRCLWTPQVLQKHQNSWFYVFPKLGHWSYKILKNEKFSDFFTFSKKFLWKKLNFHFSNFGMSMA